jgi:zinc transporter 1/2/3
VPVIREDDTILSLPMHLTEAKLAYGLAIVIAALAGGWLPLRTSGRAPSGLAFARGNALAAGLLLGIGLVHMLPEADAMWRAIVPDYPVAFVLAAAAFLAILFVEHVLLPPHEHGVAEGIGHGRTELPDELGAHLRTQHLYAYALLIALSFHSVIAGAALGMQQDNASALAIFLAIVAHKTTEGFALGVSLTRNRVERSAAIVLLALFAFATPAGILAGSLASDVLDIAAARDLDAGFLALAAGTFIYIASLDIITEEFTHGGDRGAKWCLAVVGLVLSSMLAAWL